VKELSKELQNELYSFFSQLEKELNRKLVTGVYDDCYENRVFIFESKKCFSSEEFHNLSGREKYRYMIDNREKFDVCLFGRFLYCTI
jgi:hypothetical protein